MTQNLHNQRSKIKLLLTKWKKNKNRIENRKWCKWLWWTLSSRKFVGIYLLSVLKNNSNDDKCDHITMYSIIVCQLQFNLAAFEIFNDKRMPGILDFVRFPVTTRTGIPKFSHPTRGDNTYSIICLGCMGWLPNAESFHATHSTS